MSTVRANTYLDATGGSNAVFSGVASPPNSMGFRNRIINGDMRIDQRNAGASVTPTNSQFTLDRFAFFVSQTSRLTVQQNAGSVTPPPGFSNYLGVTSSSAYSITSSDFFSLVQSIEGFNTSDFALGTASAVTFTLSFWVRSSLTGTFGGAVRNSAATRSYPFTYTINSANTWEQKSITIAGDTSGTWIGATNGIGLTVIWGLGVGSTFSGTAGAWASANFNSATGATSVVGTNGATFYITGVQLEAGTVASPFERRDYGRELMMCQRYYYLHASFAETNFAVIGPGYQASSTSMGVTVPLPVTMRAVPTLVATTGTDFYDFERAGVDDLFNSFTLSSATTNKMASMTNSAQISGTAGQAGRVITYTSGASVAFSSEL